MFHSARKRHRGKIRNADVPAWSFGFSEGWFRVYLQFMRFDLADLRLLLAVLDSGSITHGAAALNLSLPAASERIRDMEASAGVSLMHRGRRGVTATAAGVSAASYARKILRQAAELRAELSEHVSGVRASIRIVANSSAITEHLPARLGSWLAAHPGIDIELTERPSINAVKDVARNSAEFGIISDAVDIGALVVRPFVTDRLVVVMARNHPLGHAKQLAFAQTLEERHLSIAGALQDHLSEHASRLGHRFLPRIKLRTFESVCLMAAQGAGLGIVPEVAALRYRRSLAFQAVRLSDPWAKRQLMICQSPSADLYPAAKELIHHLAQRRDGADGV